MDGLLKLSNIPSKRHNLARKANDDSILNPFDSTANFNGSTKYFKA